MLFRPDKKTMIIKLLRENVHYVLIYSLTCLMWITCLCSDGKLYSQSPSYSVKKVSFSSSIYDEFSPYVVEDELIYCSNRPTNSIRKIESDGGLLFNLFFVKNKGSRQWGKPKLFSKELTTQFNDGPATFNDEMTTIYFSRNLHVDGKLKDLNRENNKIGLFSAHYSNGSWIDIKAFPYNSVDYSLVSPSLSSDGTRIYFSSDMPGGYGGYDIYYCEMIDGKWHEPINLGIEVNTPFNETHPFISKSGKLFFASDSPNGFGGKDIFYTQQIFGDWQKPTHLGGEINTEADDFGLFTDNDMQTGYFSSNRKGTDDIFLFERNKMSFDNCIEQQENNYCFVFYDENAMLHDTISSIYEWDFGEGKKLLGERVTHCFPGSGKYSVILRVMNEHTGDTINNPSLYHVDLHEKQQPYINSNLEGFVGDTLYFDGLQTNLPNYTIKEYMWNFGKDFDKSGVTVSHRFMQAGEYTIKLGVVGETDSVGTISKSCVYKKILITDKK